MVEPAQDVILPYHGVVDFSFKQLKTLADIGNEVPRNSDVLGIEAKLKERLRETVVDAAVAAKLGSPRRVINKKEIIGLRLNNNHLTELHEINKQLAVIPRSPIPKPEANLMWLDVSFNELTTVDKSILTLEHLKSLYMHGNKLGSLAVLEKLGSMPNLEKATFNGNPFEKKKIYRMFSVGAMPQLRSLDHTSVTKDEKARGIRFYANYIIQREEARIARKEAEAAAGLF